LDEARTLDRVPESRIVVLVVRVEVGAERAREESRVLVSRKGVSVRGRSEEEEESKKTHLRHESHPRPDRVKVGVGELPPVDGDGAFRGDDEAEEGES
jgi:hypothetical protein